MANTSESAGEPGLGRQLVAFGFIAPKLMCRVSLATVEASVALLRATFAGPATPTDPRPSGD